MKLQLITENDKGYGMLVENSNNVCSVKKVLNESSGMKDFIINGIYMQGDIKNRNGRIYPFLNVLLPEVKRYIAEVVNMNKSGMELNHPDNLDLDLERTCGRTRRLWDDGTNILGESLIGNYGVGALVQDLFNLGFEIGVSSRGTGTVKRDNTVDEDFRLYYIDVVFQPSAPDAIVYHAVNEADETLIKEGLISEQELNQFRTLIRNTKPSERAKYINMFNNLMNKINKG